MRIYENIITAAFLVGAVPVTAQSADTIEFVYDRAEMTTQNGIEAVRARLDNTAEAVCNAEMPRGSALRSPLNLQRCKIIVTRDLAVRINHPDLDEIILASGQIAKPISKNDKGSRDKPMKGYVIP